MSLLTSPDITTMPSFGTSSSVPLEGGEVSTHRSPRSSVLATVGVLLALPGALLVSTGVLAAAGGVLGLAGTAFAVAGLVANRHRHITGRSSAIIALVLGVAAVAAGALTVTGVVPWLDQDTNQIARLVEWLDANAAWARPEL
ncbi:MAG TPA: hypothetical protein VFY84_05780 [Jiangellales bacterium]|nr:hypothetical protein [Jiangellales bacterium]